MKNCNFSPSPFGIPWSLKYLFLGLLFTFGSCQKDFISDVAVSESEAAGLTQHLSTSRSSDLENDVVEYAQWVISNMVPLVKDPLVYEDIKSGNYSTARVISKLNALGFSGYGDFAGQFATKGGSIREAIKSGALSKETLTRLLNEHISELDLTTLGRISGNSSVPGTPCYDQFITNLAYVAVSIAIASVAATPWGAVYAGIIGVAAAYSAFHLCLDENYPIGGG